jgi:hypothetical protein
VDLYGRHEDATELKGSRAARAWWATVTVNPEVGDWSQSVVDAHAGHDQETFGLKGRRAFRSESRFAASM